MILEKIIAGLLAIVWDVESAFVQVNVTDAVISRAPGATTCTVGSANATLTSCGQSLSDAFVGLMINGVHVLNALLTGLNVSGTFARS